MAPHRRKKRKPAKDPLLKARLPIGGDFPFIPPKGWTPNMPLPRGPRNGYMDRFGREWIKGRSITRGEPFEWDVQIPPNLHQNVSLAGKITH
jgi:filamentous hemagglutinin